MGRSVEDRAIFRWDIGVEWDAQPAPNPNIKENIMCVVSMVSDHYLDKWTDRDPNRVQWPLPYHPELGAIPQPQVSVGEFNKLKEEVKELKALLIRAKKYDEDNNEPECELDDKIAKLKKIADLVGISLDDVFKGK